MNQVLQSAQERAALELKALVATARDTLLEALNEKVSKLSHQEEQEVLALVLKPTNEQSTGYVTKRTKVIIDELVGVAAKKAKPVKQPANQPVKTMNDPTGKGEQQKEIERLKKVRKTTIESSGLINTNKGNS